MQYPTGLLSVTFQALHLNFSLYEAPFRIQGNSAKLGGKGSFPSAAQVSSPGADHSLQHSTAQAIKDKARVRMGHLNVALVAFCVCWHSERCLCLPQPALCINFITLPPLCACARAG